MAMKQAAGLLVVRELEELEFLLVHPGGPFFARKDEHVWSVPKGLIDEGEEPLPAALREFREELGMPPPEGEYLSLGSVRQSRKVVHAWAVRGDLDVEEIDSNLFEMEWPPRSGKMQSFPEVDRAHYFTLAEAAPRIVKAQKELLDRALELFGA